MRGVTELRIGKYALASPVVLAPMAGVTNVAFRTLCREQELARTGTVLISSPTTASEPGRSAGRPDTAVSKVTSC